jgi:hypothetical protein
VHRRQARHPAEHDYEARLAAFCAAGDLAGATEFTRGLEDAFYASDPEAAKMRVCMVEVLGEEAVRNDPDCDE